MITCRKYFSKIIFTHFDIILKIEFFYYLDAHQFICSYCGYCANRSRNRWIQHMYDLHPPELESILDGNP